jgi:hypothetical protein
VSEQQGRAPRVDVWQQDDGKWRWKYVGVAEVDGEQLELLANEPETSEEEAVSSAELAYPGVPVEVRRRPVPPVKEDPKQLLWTGATLALTLALAGVALRYRRWWVAPLAPVLAHGVVTRVRSRVHQFT